MKISAAYGPGKFGLSFELFPPKLVETEADLYRNLPELLAFKPSFITCTYGAGGSTRDKTLEIVATIRRKHQISVASHLTCVEATRDQLREYLKAATEQGVENIVALRGDPPKGAARFEATVGGLRYANELVSLIRAEFPDFGVAVAGYPETHQEAASPEDDLHNLRRKVDAGADAVITQLFYDNEDFFRFRDRCEALGIRVPIVPGLLPITSFKQIQRITSLCKAKLPDDLVRRLSEAGDDLGSQTEVGIEHATRQTKGLLDAGIPGIHFYVLNKSQATSRILRDVGAENFPRPTES
jgi:methylenetetrahydrofolate reductase (NADPH)